MKCSVRCAWLLAILATSVAGRAQQPENQPAKPAVESKPAATAQPAAAEAPTKPVVTLIEPGAEPRQVLRLKPAIGLSQTAKLRMVMGMSMKMEDNELPSQTMPAMVLTYTMKTTSVSPEGDIGYDLAFNACDVEENAEAPPQMIEMMKKALVPISKITGSGVVTARGFNQDVKLNIPSDLDPTSAGVMEGMKQQMGQLGAPLPEEAVGAGAKWTVATKLKSQGLVLDQVAKIELLSVTDSVAKMKMVMDQTGAPNQTIKGPGMPEGVSILVESLKSSGSGDVEQPMAAMSPSIATLKIVTDMAMKMSQGGDDQKITQKITIEVKLSPGEATEKPAEKAIETPAPAK